MSYWIKVGRPKAVIKAEDTEGELYSRGGEDRLAVVVVVVALLSSLWLGKVW